MNETPFDRQYILQTDRSLVVRYSFVFDRYISPVYLSLSTDCSGVVKVSKVYSEVCTFISSKERIVG